MREYRNLENVNLSNYIESYIAVTYITINKEKMYVLGLVHPDIMKLCRICL